MILDIFQTMKNVIKYHHIVLNIVCPNVNHIRKNWASSAKIQKIRLKPIGGGVFFVLENLWCVEICDWGGVPGGEIIGSFTDNSDQIKHIHDSDKNGVQVGIFFLFFLFRAVL